MLVSRLAARRTAPRILLAGAIAATIVLSACASRSPFDEASAPTELSTPSPLTAAAGAGGAVASASGTADAAGVAATPSAPAPSGDGEAEQVPLPSKPAYAPSPAGTTAAIGTTRGPWPTTPQGRVNADKTAMLNVRTMVSVIESCHSGRPSYRDCSTAAALGTQQQLGIRIGTRRGDAQITPTHNGFRITGHSLSGAKFTMVRAPKGDRFKCIAGPKPGACPSSRLWGW